MPIQDRQQREREARIQLILRSALTTFARHGYHGTSMDLIAEQAELGKATLYYYFKSKNELLSALLENGLMKFFRELEEKWEELSSPVDKITSVVEAGARFFQENPDYFKLYSYMMAHPAMRRQVFPRLRKVIGEKMARFREIFKEAQEQGIIRDMPIDELVAIFGSLVMGMGIFVHVPDRPINLEERAKLVIEVFLNGILTKKERG